MTDDQPADPSRATSEGADAVLLDVDGTLTDTSWIHTLAWARALHRLGEDIPMHRIHPLIGMGADRLVEELLGRSVPGVGDAHHEEYVALRPEVRLLPGARELVRAIHAAGIRAVLASSAESDELEFARELLDVDGWIAGSTNSGDAEASKPDTDIFDAALRVAGVPPERAVVVGDTEWDARAACSAGIRCIGVLTGGARPRELIDAGAAEVYDDARALADGLDDSIIAALAGPVA